MIVKRSTCFQGSSTSIDPSVESDEDDLVVGVVQLRAGLEQAADDALLVVGRDVNRDEGLVAKRQPFGAVPIGVLGGPAAASDAYEVAEALLLPGPGPFMPGPEEGQEEHRGGGQVVLQ